MAEQSSQRLHWEGVFDANPTMYGEDPSAPAQHAIGLFQRQHVLDVLELGAGQGRDTVALLAAGFEVTALEYAEPALAQLRQAAAAAGLHEGLQAVSHDVRQPLPFAGNSFDAVYSHMLFCMALSTNELVALSAEVARVLRPGGIHVYTVRHLGDAHFGVGPAHGDNTYESGGFVVHFFDRALVDQLAQGFKDVEVEPFEEGDLPRRLWRVTSRRIGSPIDIRD